MKFRLSTMLLAIALVMVSTGWLAERWSYEKKLTDTLDETGAVSAGISSAFIANKIYSDLDTQSELENAERRNSILHLNVLVLFNNLDDTKFTRTERETILGRYYVTRDERSKSLIYAGMSLALLGLHDADAYPTSYFEEFSEFDLFDGLVDEDRKTLTKQFREFIIEAINAYDSDVIQRERFLQRDIETPNREGGIF